MVLVSPAFYGLFLVNKWRVLFKELGQLTATTFLSEWSREGGIFLCWGISYKKKVEIKSCFGTSETYSITKLTYSSNVQLIFWGQDDHWPNGGKQPMRS